MNDDLYEITGDNGGLFCMCEDTGDDFILRGKNTELSLNALVRKAASHESRRRSKPSGIRFESRKQGRDMT